MTFHVQDVDMESLIQQAADDLAASKNTAALTGAGISVESGIPPFRGKGGLWEKFDPMAVAHIDALMRDPVKVWRDFLKDLHLTVGAARPNAAHLGLARLEMLGILKTVITQNIDGLHQAAGSTEVIEFHGTAALQRCMACNRRVAGETLNLSQIPPRCSCGGIYRPEVIFFGEAIPPDALLRSRRAAAECDVMLVVGTSAMVQPAAYMPVIAKESGARVIEINPEPTALTGRISDYLIAGQAGRVITQILEKLTLRQSEKCR